MINKVVNKIIGLQTKIWSFGGKVTLIKHDNLSLLIFWQPSILRPQSQIRFNELWLNFYGERRITKRRITHLSRIILVFLLMKVGLEFDFRVMFLCPFSLNSDGCLGLPKRCVAISTKKRYCQRSSPLSIKWVKGESQTWTHMMTHKHTTEKHIHLKINSWYCSCLMNNWLGVGPLE